MKRNVIRTTDVPVDERRREITSHGTRAFPVAIYYDVLKENVLGYVNWHWHEELQFCLVAQGFVDFFVGSKHICLGEGQGLFINSRALHMIRPGSEDAIYICLNYSPLLLGLYPGSVFHEKYVMPFISSEVAAIEFGKDLDWHTAVARSIEEVYEIYEGEEYGDEYKVVHILQNMWLSIIMNAEEFRQRSVTVRRRNTSVHEMLDYINEHYNEKIRIDDIADAVSFSRSECCRLFKRELGETIFSYLKKYRIERSTELLRDTDMSITDIAYEVGFGETSYYIKTFREVLGVTPKQYRNR